MEMADVFVVIKSDKEGADKVAADVQVMLKMLGEREWVPPVALVSSNKNTGIDEVKDIIKNHSAYLQNSEEGKRRRWSQLEMEVEAILRGEISLLVENAWKERRTDSLMDELSSRKADPYTLAGEIIQKVVK